MKSVGIVTFHFADNYGAVLQAYGMITCLKGMKFDARIINYCPAHVDNGGDFRLPVSKKNIRADMIIIYQKLMKFKSMLFNDNGLKYSFEKFRQNHFQLTDIEYKRLDELQSSPPVFDVYITGSDQVWNPSEQYGVDQAYFLGFGNKVTKRIAYAASFGRSVVPDEYHSEIGKYLDVFDKISIREKSGVNFINRISNFEALWMPDPTLLIKDYSNIINFPAQRNSYLFSYVLRSGKGISEIQRYVANKLNLEIIVPHNPMKRWKDVGETIYPTPEEWLGYIKKSEFVVTNSFHGTMFSILFNRPFITIGLAGKKDGLNERARSLLERLGLEDRLVTDISIDVVDLLLNKKIDWKAVNKEIEKWRQEGLDFLSREIV